MTIRQKHVLDLITQGYTDKEIALRLGLSPRTVHTHVRALLRRTGTPNRAALVAWAFRQGVAA